MDQCLENFSQNNGLYNSQCSIYSNIITGICDYLTGGTDGGAWDTTDLPIIPPTYGVNYPVSNPYLDENNNDRNCVFDESGLNFIKVSI